MSIIQISDLELLLQTTISGTTNEDKYEFLIGSVQALAEKICFRKFDLQEYVSELYDGNSGNELSLNQFPVTSVSEVLYGSVFGNGTRTEILSTDYLVYYDMGILAFNFNSPDDANQIFAITYTAGWTDANPSDGSSNAPEDLKLILMQEVETQFETQYVDPLTKSEKLGDWKIERFGAGENRGSSIFTQKLSKYIKSSF